MQFNSLIKIIGICCLAIFLPALNSATAAAKDNFHIKNKKSGFCLDGYAFGKEVKAALCRRHYDAQRWTLVPRTKEIKHTKSNFCLNISVSNMDNGAKIVLWNCNGGKNQQWKIENSGELRSLMNNKCIDLARIFPKEKSTRIHMWDCKNKKNQHWSAVNVGVK